MYIWHHLVNRFKSNGFLTSSSFIFLHILAVSLVLQQQHQHQQQQQQQQQHTHGWETVTSSNTLTFELTSVASVELVAGARPVHHSPVSRALVAVRHRWRNNHNDDDNVSGDYDDDDNNNSNDNNDTDHFFALPLSLTYKKTQRQHVNVGTAEMRYLYPNSLVGHVMPFSVPALSLSLSLSLSLLPPSL